MYSPCAGHLLSFGLAWNCCSLLPHAGSSLQTALHDEWFNHLEHATTPPCCA
jgi:hypothetical protein